MILCRSNLTELERKKLIRKEDSNLVYRIWSKGKSKMFHISAIQLELTEKYNSKLGILF